MTRWGAAAVAVVIAAAPIAAQTTPTVVVTGPFANPITDGIATFSIRTADFAPADLPLRLELQVSTKPDFSGVLFADTTVDGSSADIVIPRILPGSGELYWRAFALTARAGSVPSLITGPRAAPTHLKLLSPNNPAGQLLTTRRPTFVWHASNIPPAVGAWDFELHVELTSTGLTTIIASTSDTTLTLAADLEANTSYRWRVRARVRATGDSVEVASTATFVIQPNDAPLATLLLTPFPQPFPTPTSSSTCIWFDLQNAGPVMLDVIDFVHGLPVRQIVPGRDVGGSLPAGRYGRPFPGATSGCDDRFSWDGTDRNGRVVPAGLYIIRLVAGGRRYTKTVQFRGR